MPRTQSGSLRTTGAHLSNGDAWSRAARHPSVRSSALFVTGAKQSASLFLRIVW